MGDKRKPKLYLAGPEVFLPNAVEVAKRQKELCEKYGFIGLHPMDNNIDLSGRPREVRRRIYRGDIGQIRECDIVVANCNSFRGALMDDGTAYELGFGNALGKPSYGYIRSLASYMDRISGLYPCTRLQDDLLVDRDGYLLVYDFGTSINLMMQEGMEEFCGRLVVGNFEACLRAIRHDLDSDEIRLRPQKWIP